MPFDQKEFEKILKACDEFSASGRYKDQNRVRIKALVQSANENWSTPTIGKRVKSLTTRGRYVGATGTILRIEDGEFNRYDRIAVVDLDGEEFRYPGKINIQRLEVVGEPDQKELLRAAQMRVANQGVMSVIRSWSYV